MANTPKTPQELIDKIWEKGEPIRGKDPEKYRADPYGNEIYKPSYGKQGEKSWVIDHKKPLDKGGSENSRNLQPLQTQLNLQKGAKYPFNPKPSKPRGR